MFPGHLTPDSAGCAGVDDGGDGKRRICTREPVVTIKHEVGDARTRIVRVFVCEAHAVGQTDPRPLTSHDRSALRRRRARRDGQGRG